MDTVNGDVQMVIGIISPILDAARDTARRVAEEDACTQCCYVVAQPASPVTPRRSPRYPLAPRNLSSAPSFYRSRTRATSSKGQTILATLSPPVRFIVLPGKARLPRFPEAAGGG